MTRNKSTEEDTLWPELGLSVGVGPDPLVPVPGAAVPLSPGTGAPVLKTIVPIPVSVKTVVDAGALTVHVAIEPASPHSPPIKNVSPALMTASVKE